MAMAFGLKTLTLEPATTIKYKQCPLIILKFDDHLMLGYGEAHSCLVIKS